MIFDLPTTVEFGGKAWEIRTDYREILTVLTAFDDPELDDREKAFVCLNNLYVDFEHIPQDEYQAAMDAILAFIDRGSDDKDKGPRTMDWQQDAPILFPAVNHVAGYEVRSADYLHWWTFMGFFMEIKDSTYATVLSLRQKKKRGKKLEKYEQEFWRNNRNICELRQKETDEDKAKKAELTAILGPR